MPVPARWYGTTPVDSDADSIDKIIITEDGEEINLTHLEREFGSYRCV